MTDLRGFRSVRRTSAMQPTSNRDTIVKKSADCSTLHRDQDGPVGNSARGSRSRRVTGTGAPAAHRQPGLRQGRAVSGRVQRLAEHPEVGSESGRLHRDLNPRRAEPAFGYRSE